MHFLCSEHLTEPYKDYMLAISKTVFYTNQNNKGEIMSDSIFKGVKLTSAQCDYIQRVADLSFEGNFSMALRHVLSKVMALQP